MIFESFITDCMTLIHRNVDVTLKEHLNYFHEQTKHFGVEKHLSVI